MGLGDRGKEQVKKGTPGSLFAKTEPEFTESHNSVNSEIHKYKHTEVCKTTSEKNDQRKMYNLSLSLSERLRKCAFDTRRKEVEIVREALDSWLKEHDY